MAIHPQSGAIVVSGYAESGAQGGGVFIVGHDGVEVIDEQPTTGIFFDEAASRWLRAMSTRELGLIECDVREYCASNGEVSVQSLATVSDAHDVFTNATQRLAIDTLGNSLVELGSGTPTPVRVLPGEPDSWHLNCLEDVQGELFASAFHRGGTFRQWSGNEARSGFVFSLASGTIVADGLTMPHSPRLVDGLWIICNSSKNELIAVDPLVPLDRVKSVKLGGYTRGLAYDRDNFYVGISAMRQKGDHVSAKASLAIVDRKSWKLIDRVPVPCPEIYDVLLVPEWAPAILKTLMPESEAPDDRGLGSADRPLSATGQSDGVPAGLSVRFIPPDKIRAGDVFYVPTRLEHSGNAPLVASPDTPLQLSYRWTGVNDMPPLSIGSDEPLRTSLPPTLTPGSHSDVDVVIRAPALAGRYRLRVVLVQEYVRWLDTVEPDAFLDVLVDVGEPSRQ